MLRAGLLLLALVPCGGCARLRGGTANAPCDDCLPPPVAGRYCYHRHLDNFLSTQTAQRCARRDLKQVQDECGSVSRDFRDGYTQAYIDLASGRPPSIPAVPPRKYWHAWHRSCAGRDAVDEWYAGYRVGLEHGLGGGVSRFNRIVPCLDGGCVSAAYVNPYGVPTTPTGVVPADRQTISHGPASAAAHLGAVSGEPGYPVAAENSGWR
jgi:hypothetical protein